MSFYNILTGGITNTTPTVEVPSINVRVPRPEAATQLASWLSDLALIGQVLSVESYATKSAVKQFNKISKSAYQLAAKLGVKNVIVSAVYNPFGITNSIEWITKFNGIIGRQRQVFTDANWINLAGLSRSELVLARDWASWRKTFLFSGNLVRV